MGVVTGGINPPHYTSLQQVRRWKWRVEFDDGFILKGQVFYKSELWKEKFDGIAGDLYWMS